jgi:two-component system sensor histidine kinase UhpB
MSVPAALGPGLVLFAGGFVCQVIFELAGRDRDGHALVWLPGGLLLAALMSGSTARWIPCTAGCALGVAVAAQLPERSAIPAASALVLTLVLVPLAAHLMRALCSNPSPVHTFRNLAVFLTIFVMALPALSAAAVFAADPSPDSYVSAWTQTGLAHALGYLAFVTIWFKPRARWATLRRMFVPDSWPTLAALASIAAIGILWNALGELSYARPILLLAPIPVLVFTALRARVAGVYVLFVLIAIIAVELSRAGRGPFIENDVALTALSLRCWLLATAIASWLLAVLVEQRSDMRRALVHSSREVRELAGRLIEAQEQERSRIARDLHDDVNQRLASVSIELSTIRRASDPQRGVELGLLQDELIALSEDVRHISHNLHPSMLHEIGLEAGLGSLCNTQRHRNGPSIDLRVAPSADNVPDAIALCLYRGAQEAIGNAIRHARAQRIEVMLDVVDNKVELRIADDGAGFNSTPRPKGLGLISLEERAKLLGGRFEVITSPGKGTQICIRIPLPSRAPH